MNVDVKTRGDNRGLLLYREVNGVGTFFEQADTKGTSMALGGRVQIAAKVELKTILQLWIKKVTR